MKRKTLQRVNAGIVIDRHLPEKEQRQRLAEQLAEILIENGLIAFYEDQSIVGYSFLSATVYAVKLN